MRRQHIAKPIPDKYLCRVCRQRWIQQAGRCNACLRLTLSDLLKHRQQLDAERVAKEQAQINRLRRPDMGPRSNPERVYRGITYEVVWDGA